MSDLYADDFDDQDDSGQGQRGSNPVADLRAKVRRLEKEAKERELELTELREFKSTTEAVTRKSGVAKAFEDLGLPEAYAELYPSEAEPTKEAVKAFALKYGWVQPASADESEAEEQVSPTFNPASYDGSAPASKTVKAEDLLRMSPKEAQAAIAQGRVSDLDDTW